MDKGIKPVFWTERAIKDLEKLKLFNVKLYGKSKGLKIILSVKNAVNILESSEVDTSEIGSVDEEFSHLKYKYRKLLHKHCKITYRVGKTKIYINRIFDTRQNPSKNQ